MAPASATGAVRTSNPHPTAHPAREQTKIRVTMTGAGALTIASLHIPLHYLFLCLPGQERVGHLLLSQVQSLRVKFLLVVF